MARKRFEVERDTRPVGSVNWASHPGEIADAIHVFNEPYSRHAVGNGKFRSIETQRSAHTGHYANKWGEHEQFEAMNERKGFGRKDEE